MSSLPTIVFRADGNSRTGLGHLYRSTALAQMIKEEYNCILATRCTAELLIKELSKAFRSVVMLPQQDVHEEAGKLHQLIRDMDLIVLDGYHFDSKYQAILKSKGVDFFCIDDIHAFQFYSDIIINHAGGLSPLDYQALPSTQFFLGPQYALLQPPFIEAAAQRRREITDNNCFVCFGGADPGNKTLEVLNRQKLLGSFDEIHAVVGNAYTFKTELEAFAKKQKNVFVHAALPATEMAGLMKRCSFAICSPSTVVYEYLSVGGIVFLEQIADNQTDVIRYFISEGIAFPLDRLGSISSQEASCAFKNGARFFDGKSPERFRKIFSQYFESRKLGVRKVKAEDLERCYQWANDPEVRKQSYNQQPISMEEHTRWFRQKLTDPKSFFYILELNGAPVAQIRFQVNTNEAVLGYLAAPEIRSKGLGTAILAKGIQTFLKETGRPMQIAGYVKRSNIASQRSFERLAFQKEEATGYPDSFKYTMIYGNTTR